MELDKIIYDKDKLSQALTDQLLAESPTFNSMYPSDTATALVNLLAAYGSMLNYFFASAMANCYTDSAFSDTGIRQLAKTLGNRLHGNEPAQTFITIKKNNLQAKDISIPAYSSFTINNKKFFNPSAVILSATNPVVTQVPLIQGEIVSVDKVTSGIAGEKLYFSSNYKASMNYTTVTVGESEWEIVDSFLPYDENYVEDASETEKVVLETEADGRCYIKFGDGVLGTLPASGTAVNIKYVSNDGELGNIPQVNLPCTLTTPLVYINSLNNQEALDITAYTTSTIYGGFGKQSIETLRLTSPYVFASGHRAIRRKDYISLLQNQCGYLTSSVWGEYEESQYKGTYDSLMMNMVYYSGIKSFESYSAYEIGAIDTADKFTSASNTTRAFWGTYLVKVNNIKNDKKDIEIRDTGAKGLLFINDNNLDKRDSLLEPWVNYGDDPNGTNIINLDTNDQVVEGYSPIINARTDHSTMLCYSSDQSTISLLTPKQILIDCHANPKTLTALKFRTNSSDDPFIGAFTVYGTNDVNEETIGDWKTNAVFVNIRNSANWDNLTGRVNVPYPGSESWTDWIPTNLAMNLNSDESYKTYNYYVIEVYDVNTRAASDKPQLVINKIKGLFIEDSSTIDYDSNGKIEINFPVAGNSGASEYYVITTPTSSAIETGGSDYEIGDELRVLYGTQDTQLRIKITAVDDGSIQDFDWIDGINYYKTSIGQFDETLLTLDNLSLSAIGTGGKLRLSSKYSTELVEDLIGSEDYPIYYYVPTYDGLTRANGYRSGNQLAYIYNDTTTQKDIVFVVKIDNIDTGANTTCLGTDLNVQARVEGSDLNYKILYYDFNNQNNLKLTGNPHIALTNPASLDEIPIYEFISTTADKVPGAIEEGYAVNNILKVLVATEEGGNTYVDTGARIKIDNVSNGIVTAFHWDTPYVTTASLNGLIAKTEPADSSTGTGLQFKIVTKSLSGSSAGLGSGGTIDIKSENNLVITTSFTGNRIDTNDINKVDQPIINKYNHFTTYTEFVQPEAYPVSVSLDVSLDTSYSRSSGIIIQEIKNAVTKLFEITPDFLGSGLKISDIYTSVMAVPGVNWCLITSPTNNIEIKQNELMTLQDVKVNEIIKEFK